MKRFAFSLERVLAWRQMQARMERLRWEQIRAELHGIEAERELLRGERERSAARLQAAGAALGADLAALDAFRRYVDAERARLEQKRAECEERLIAQTQVMTAKERDVKILKHLRERRLETWTEELLRETEQQANEAFLARWRAGASAAHRQIKPAEDR